MQSSMVPSSASLRLNRQQRRVAPRRVSTITRAGLLDFLKAPKVGGRQSGRAQEIVDELLAVTKGTDGGDKASQQLRQQVAELVDELEQFGPRDPVRSPLLWGDYEVLYASRTGTVATPFKSPVGRIVFPGLESSQELRPPNLVVNKANYKALGLIPGGVTQEGTFERVDGKTIKITFSGLGGGKGGPRERTISIAYLDERIRVARFVPPPGEEEDKEPLFYVLKRKQEATAEEEGEADEQPAAPGPFAGLGARGGSKKEGLATQVERSYYRNKGQQGGGSTDTRGSGSVRRGISGTGSFGTRKQQQPAQPQTAEERAAAREAAARERKAAQEAAAREREERQKAAAAAKAAAEAERRASAERQAAEREAARERAAAIKAQLQELSGQAQQSQEAAREAAKALKDAEKDAAPLLRQAASARQALESVVSAALAASQQVASLKEEEKAAGREADAARKEVRRLESLARGGK